MMLKEDRRAEVVTNQVKVKVQPSLWIDSTLRKNIHYRRRRWAVVNPMRAKRFMG